MYRKYRALFDWFDALLVGLTATPKDEVDRNTYEMFHLENGFPTDAYPLEQAVADGYLVPPTPISVRLRFQLRGHPLLRAVRGGERRVGRPGMG